MPQQDEIKTGLGQRAAKQFLERGGNSLEMSTRKSCLKQGKLGMGHGKINKVLGLSNSRWKVLTQKRVGFVQSEKLAVLTVWD